MTETYMKTKAKFPGHYFEFDKKIEDDGGFDQGVLMEIVNVTTSGEVEIKFDADHFTEYVTFRLKDLLRAVKEFEA